MTIHYLDFYAYVIISAVAYVISPEKCKEELAILGWFVCWFVFTVIWLFVFVYPVDLNISDLFNIHFNVKLKP